MTTPFASSAVIGWIEIRPEMAASDSWLAPADDDLLGDLCRLGGKSTEPGASSSSKTPRFAPRTIASGYSPAGSNFGPASSGFAPAGSSGAIGQIFANLAGLSQELDARLADIRARITVA